MAGGLVAVLAVVLVTSAEPRLRTLLIHTCALAGGSSALALLPGTLLAVLIAKTDLPGRRVAVALLAALLLTPLYLQAAAWQTGFGDGGWTTRVLHIPPLLIGWRGALWVHAVASVPWIALLVGLSLRQLPAGLEEQAIVDGSGWQVFGHVTLRSIAGGMGIGMLWTAASAAAEITVSDLFQIRTYAEEIYTRLNLVGWDRQPALVLWDQGTALVLLGVAAAGVACLHLAPRAQRMTARPRWKWRLGRWRPVAAAVVALTLLLLVAVPLINLFAQAGLVVSISGVGRIRRWSLARAVGLVASSPRRFASELEWSLLIGMVAASAAVILSLALSWLGRRGGLWTAPIVAVAAFALALPGPSVGLGLIRLLNHPDSSLLVWLYDRTLLAPAIGQTIRALPLTLLILWYAVATIPTEMLERAAADGAGPVARLLKIVFPYRAATIAGAWLIALVLAMGELAVTLLTAPPGMPTLSVRLFGLLHYGVDDRLAAICLAQIALTAALIAIAYALIGRRDRRPDVLRARRPLA